jgi:hypothetical protein
MDRVEHRRRTALRRQRDRSRAGLTLLELTAALALLMLGLVGYLQVIVLTAAAAQTAREQTLAAQSVRRVAEEMKAHTFADVFALYNTNPNDDPGGAGTGPGRNFAIAGLTAAPDDVDGFVGEVDFPTSANNLSVLRENIADARFGTPRDLNHDGNIDGANHATDYQLLPVVVRARWRGKSGIGTFQVKTLLVELP